MGDRGIPEIQMRYLEPKHHLGRGAFGQVIKAVYRNEPVAMKVLEKDTEPCRKQFLNEMEQLHSLRHPNIIKVYGKCCNTKLGFIMELMDNGSVEDLLHRHLHMVYKVDHVVSWARQCADAVSFIHDRGFVHRDLKPTNLLLKDDFRVLKLCDFGTVSTVKTTMTNNQGTPSYMAPQVFTGRKYDVKCDVYSFGITLWEMTTRKRPFGEEASSYTILWKAYEGHRPSVITDPACPPVVMELIANVDVNVYVTKESLTQKYEVLKIWHCWDKNPNVRLPMKQVLEILTQLTMIFPNGSDLLDNTENVPTSVRIQPGIPEIAVSPAEMVVGCTPEELVDGTCQPGPSTDTGYHSGEHYPGQPSPVQVGRPSTSEEGHLKFLDAIDPGLRPIPPTRCEEEDQNLYYIQVVACEDLYRIEQQLQHAYIVKHKLIARLRHLEETSHDLDRREQLRNLLQESHVRICSQRQIPPTPL